MGTPQEITNENGEIVWQVALKAWGGIDRVYVEQVGNNLRFQGQYYDQETELHYNRFRHYDPSAGMFINQDPIGLLGGEKPSAYALNPIEWVDPLGLAGLCPLKWNGPRDRTGLSRKDHIRRHNVDDPNRDVAHGVFNKNGIQQTQEAWQTAQRTGIRPNTSVGGNDVYIVPSRNAGWQGGNPNLPNYGARADYIKIVTRPGTSEIVTSYPIVIP